MDKHDKLPNTVDEDVDEIIAELPEVRVSAANLEEDEIRGASL